MSTSLDDLRIERRSGSPPSRAPWLVVVLLLAAIAGGAFWLKRGPLPSLPSFALVPKFHLGTGVSSKLCFAEVELRENCIPK